MRIKSILNIIYEKSYEQNTKNIFIQIQRHIVLFSFQILYSQIHLLN